MYASNRGLRVPVAMSRSSQEYARMSRVLIPRARRAAMPERRPNLRQIQRFLHIAS